MNAMAASRFPVLGRFRAGSGSVSMSRELTLTGPIHSVLIVLMGFRHHARILDCHFTDLKSECGAA